MRLAILGQAKYPPRSITLLYFCPKEMPVEPQNRQAWTDGSPASSQPPWTTAVGALTSRSIPKLYFVQHEKYSNKVQAHVLSHANNALTSCSRI